MLTHYHAMCHASFGVPLSLRNCEVWRDVAVASFHVTKTAWRTDFIVVVLCNLFFKAAIDSIGLQNGYNMCIQFIGSCRLYLY